MKQRVFTQPGSIAAETRCTREVAFTPVNERIAVVARLRLRARKDLSRCSKTLIVGFLPGFRSTKSGLPAACSAGYAALFAAATLAPTTRALNSSTVITSAVENASIVNVARWTSAADSAP